MEHTKQSHQKQAFIVMIIINMVGILVWSLGRMQDLEGDLSSNVTFVK